MGDGSFKSKQKMTKGIQKVPLLQAVGGMAAAEIPQKFNN
jgi:hypothetical protein